MSDLIYLASGVVVLLVFAGYAALLKARLIMLMILLYAAGGVAIAVYMVAALLRPEKF